MADREVTFTVKIKDAATAALKEVENAAGKVGEKLIGLKDVLGALTAAAASVSLVEVVKDMVDLGVATDKTFRQIAASLPTATEGIAGLKEQIKELGQVTGHSVEQLEQSAAAIARLGVSSAAELGQQLEAATKLADATGTSVDEAAQLLVQLRREFHLTGNEALETAAKLASAAQGKVAITELFSAFQNSSIIFEKFNIDIDTGTKAIIALVERGMSIRAIRSELNALDASGIKELASQATIASDALEQLDKRTAITEGSIDASLTRLKNSWNEALKSIFDGVKGFAAGAASVLGGILDAGMVKSSPVVSATFTDISTKGPLPKLPQTAAEKKAAEESALAVQKLNLQLQEMAAAEHEAAEKAKELARAQGVDLKIAIEAALGAASGHVAEAAAAAIDDRAKKLTLEVALNQSLDMATKTRLLNEIELTRQLEQENNRARPILEQGSLLLAGVGAPGHAAQSDLTALMVQEQALREEARRILELHGDDSKEQAQILEIEKKRNEIEKGLLETVKQQPIDIAKIAAEWSAVGRSIIAAGQAVGALDDKTASTLQNVISFGDAIVKIFSGNVAGGLVEAISSLGGILHSLFGSDNSAARQAEAALLQRHIEAMKSLTDALYKASRGQFGIPSGISSGEVQTVIGYATGPNPRGIIEAWKIKELADALGVTLDGSAESLQAFVTLLENTVLPGIIATEKATADAAAAAAAAREEQIKEQTEDYKVRQERAQGKDAEADADAFREGQQREWQKAVEDSGLSADDFAKSAEGVQLAATQAAEAQKFYADAMEKAAQAAYDAANATLAADTDVYGYDPTTEATKRAAAYGIDLSQFDLSTKQGVDAAIQWLQNDYGSSTDAVRKQEDKALIDNLRRITFPGDVFSTSGIGATSGPTSSIAAGYQSITTVQGNALADIGLRTFDVLKNQLAVQMDIRNYLRPTYTPPTVAGGAPQGASGTTAAGGRGGSSITVNVAPGAVTLAGGDTSLSGAQFDAALARQINIVLSQSLLQQAIYRGTIDVAAPFSG